MRIVSVGVLERRRDIYREPGECGRRRMMVVGDCEEDTLARAWRVTRSSSLGLKGGKTRDVPVHDWEKGLCVAPKRLSAG